MARELDLASRHISRKFYHICKVLSLTRYEGLARRLHAEPPQLNPYSKIGIGSTLIGLYFLIAKLRSSGQYKIKSTLTRLTAMRQ